MIRTLTATALIAAAFAVPASAQPVPDAPTYVERSGESDLFEITTSLVAMMKSRDDAVRGFAQQMINHHTLATNNALAAAGEANVLPPPPTLDAQQRATVTRLLNATGAEFDRMFWQVQVDAHRKALQMQRAYAANGQTPQLRTFASRIAPVIAEHLEDAQQRSAQ